ncbi:hypothetical protein T484DRAFT_1969679 [Baffinella frigidus]|nr:hypothetical protein T484DRAFT_1969679 [Cryptophyta sp. CCMP2293]
MTARAMLESPVGNQITPSGRPTNWLPESERAMVFFSLATRRNSRAHHKILLASVQESEARVKMVRAGQMATDVLVERRTDSVASKAETEAPSQAPRAVADPGSPSLTLAPLARAGKGAPSSRLLSGLSTSRAAASPGAASTKAGDASVVKTAVGEEGGLLLSQPTARVLGSRGRNERRANAVAGNHVLMHPVPPLKLVAETFFEDVEALTSRVHSDLSANSTERMDTFRRKFKNFQLGEAGSTAEAQLQAMRVSAEQEKLRNEIYLYQNRKWYSLLMHQVADNSSDEQRELLKKISEMVEGGVITKATVRELLNIMSERGKVEHFTSKPIQAVFEFLCEQFGVLGQEYDSWLEDNSLPLPPSTLSRYEAARQKRLQLFQRDLVAKHWRQRFDMLSTTKNLADWLPDDVVDAVIETARQLSPRSHSARSVNSSHAPSRSAQSRPQSSTSRRSAANNLTIERSLDNLGQDVPLNPAKDDGGGDNASGEEAGGEMQPVPSMGASVLMADMGEAAPAFEPAAPLGAPA